MEGLLTAGGILLGIEVMNVEETKIAILHADQGGTHKILRAVTLEHTALDPGLTLVVGADAGDIGRTEVVTVAIEVRPSIENGVILRRIKQPSEFL
jgi:hypothetical protein